MPAASWFRRWTTRTTRRPAPIERPAARRFAVRPRLEVLEDRHVPAPVVTANLLPAGGTLDPSFGTRGIQTINVSAAPGDGTGDAVSDPTQLAEGRIVAPVRDNGLTVGFRRFLANGSPDLSFGSNGRALLTLPPADGAYAAYALAGEDIVVATQSGSNVYLTQLDQNGNPDTAGTQRVSTDINGPIRMTVLSSGKILLAGGTDTGIALVRCTANRVPDPTFNSASGAEVRTPAPDFVIDGGKVGLYNSPAAMVIQPSGGKIGGGDSNFAVFRFKCNGELDTSFGKDVFTGQSSGWNDQVLLFDANLVGSDPLSALALDPRDDGGIIAAGNYGIVRYTKDGTLDTQFGPVHDGVLTYPGVAVSFVHALSSANSGHRVDLGLGLGANGIGSLFPAGVAVQPDGTIVLGGPLQNATRLNVDGTVDPNFGQSGILPSAAGGASTGMVFGAGAGATLVGNDANGNITLVRFLTAPAPTAVVVGQPFTLAAYASDPNLTDQAAGFTYQIDWGDGSSVPPSSGNGARFTIGHTFASVPVTPPGRIQVTVTDANGTQTVWLAVTVEPLMTNGLQHVLNGTLPTDQAGNPSVNLQITSADQAGQFLNLFTSATPMSVPAGTTIDLYVNLAHTDLPTHSPVSIPDGLNVYMTDGQWHGDSPALTLLSGNLTISNSTFVNATNAPTILVTCGHLTLRNDVIQESTGYDQVAISVTGGTVDLGTAASPGGNIFNVNSPGAFAQNTTATPISAVGDAFTVNGAPLMPGSLSGIAWEDFNDDGQVDFGEKGIAGVAITLTGTDDLGNPVNLAQTTDADGAYVFLNLRPGSYRVTEAQPTGYLQGSDTVGTAGGSLAAADQFLIPLGVQVNGLNYNFGEQPAATGSVKKGQAAGIGFWNNKNGQALIKALPVVTNADGSVTSVANWLAATLPHMFGAAAANDLTGKSNADVAALFQQDFVLKGVKVDAQVLATALSVYATSATLDSTAVAAPYGFAVGGDGLGAAAVSVGSDGDAFGVANNTTMTVMDLLLATDAQAVNGVLYAGNATKRSHANDVYSFVNQAGGF
jgi:uncharacterized delta-60 repeat protein